MNDQLFYTGAVTLVQKMNNRIVSKKFYNRGEDRLFEAYARAISGQSISNFIPKRIDFGTMNGDIFTSKVRSGVSIPVVTSYKDAGADGGDYEDGGVKVPYCRVSTALFTDMFESMTDETVLTARLQSSNGATLASVDIQDLARVINNTSSGIQLLLLWDLYITN